jgi:ABC-type uncharacterized transport system fused permease/ATPase subunit
MLKSRSLPVKRFIATLATIWRLALPYFRSEDRWPGRALLGAVIAMELGIVALNVMFNQWTNRFYNALQEYQWDDLHHTCRVSALSQSMAADPLATLDDR